MKLTQEDRTEFERLCRPLIMFLNNKCYPHVSVIITTTHAELLEGVCAFATIDYVKD